MHSAVIFWYSGKLGLRAMTMTVNSPTNLAGIHYNEIEPTLTTPHGFRYDGLKQRRL